MWANSYFTTRYFDGEYFAPISGEVQLPGPGDLDGLGVYDLGRMLAVHGGDTGVAAVGHNTGTGVLVPDRSLVAAQGDTGLAAHGSKDLDVTGPEHELGSGQGKLTLETDDDKRLH